MARIEIPGNFDELLKLFDLIYKKHKADGADSPLGSFDLEARKKSSSAAQAHDQNAKDLAKKAEDATQDRNNEFQPVEDDIRAIAQLLKQIHRDNPKELGNWGFDVVGE